MADKKKSVTGEHKSSNHELLGKIIVRAGAIIEQAQQLRAKGEAARLRQIADGLQVLQSAEETAKLFLSGAPTAQIASPKSNLPGFLVKLKQGWEEMLSEKLKRKIVVRDNEFPAELTGLEGEKNLELWKKMKFPPIFLPGMTVHPGSSTYKKVFEDWVMPPSKYYDWARNGKIRHESGKIIKKPFVIKRGIYLADANISVDYDRGVQVYPDDSLSTINSGLRETGQVGKYDNTPLGSRFAIKPTSEWPLVCQKLKSVLNIPQRKCGLMPHIYFVAIGNLYYPRYGEYNSWLWFKELFEDSYRLYGGNRVYDGLALVYYYWSYSRYDYTAARPLVSFA